MCGNTYNGSTTTTTTSSGRGRAGSRDFLGLYLDITMSVCIIFTHTL